MCTTSLLFGMVILGIIVLLVAIFGFGKNINKELKGKSKLQEKIASLMAINWDNIYISPDRIIVVKKEGNKRCPYFITGVEEEKKVTKHPDGFHFLFPFSGIILDDNGLNSLKTNPNTCKVKRYIGTHEYGYGPDCLDSESLKVIDWELLTEGERIELLGQIKGLLQKEGLHKDTILLFQRIEKSLTKEEI